MLACLSPAAAAVSYIQGNFGTPTSAQSVSVTYSAAQSAGDLNVVFVGWDDATSTVQSITDTSGNTYAIAAGPTINPGNATQVVYYAKNIAAAAAGINTITVTFNHSVSYPDVRILEYSGINSINPLDTSVSAYGNGVTLNSGTLTTTTANDLLLASGNVQHSYTGGAGSGYTQVLVSQWNLVEQAIVTGTGTYSATSTDSSGYWVMQLVAFRGANTGGDQTPPTVPVGLIATSSSSDHINLRWTASSDDVGVSAYLIERCQGLSCSNFTQIQSSTTPSFVDTGLNASTSYTYRVRASDVAGNLGGYSNTASTTTTAPGAAYVQGNFGTPTSASTVTVAYASAQNAGDLNVVFVGWDDASSTLQSITDTKGNAYVRAVGPTVNPGNTTQLVYYAKNIVAAAAGANTVTVTFSGSVSYPDIRVLEFSGIDQSNPFEVGVGAYGSGTTLSSGPLTTVNARDLLVASGNVQHVYSGGAGAGYTQILASQWNLVEDALVNTAGSYTATSSAVSGYWVMQLAAFRATPLGLDTTAPSAPLNLSAAAVSASQINLTWTGSTDDVGVAGYIISRCQGAGCSAFAPLGSSSTATFADATAAPSSYYTYVVRAIDFAGNVSAESNPSGASTSAGGGSGGGGSGSGGGGSGGGSGGSGSPTNSTYEYDSTGHLITVTTAAGVITHYHYDAAGHLVSISTP